MPIQATLSIQGIAELKNALAQLPAELKGQATQIVLDTAYAAQADVISQYPQGATGNLKKGVKVTVKEVGPFAVAARIRSSAPHAWWHEYGHELTHIRKTKKGWPRGIMFSQKGIPRPVFIPTMVRHRRWMYQKLAALIASTGLIVKHDEAA